MTHWLAPLTFFFFEITGYCPVCCIADGHLFGKRELTLLFLIVLGAFFKEERASKEVLAVELSVSGAH